jgi:transcriptional regulator with PAS, ATPase and Fis domain
MGASVVGETGTGKEAVAEAIHRLSPRAAAPFVRLHCAALTETLVESARIGVADVRACASYRHSRGCADGGL